MKFPITPFAVVILCWLVQTSGLSGQVRQKPGQATPDNQTEEETGPQTPEQVVIQRQVLNLIDPKVYQVPLHLVPSKFVTVVSPATGVITSMPVKPGDQLSPQAELFQLEDSIEELLVKQAKAQVAAQQARVEQAKSGDTKAQAIAAADLIVAEVGLEIANTHLAKKIVRAEEAVEVFRTHAVPGELVTLYQKVVDIGVPTTMTVEIPVNRNDVKQDGTISIKVEEQDVDAKVVAILPPAERFEPLRDLFDSLASAQLEIENRNKTLKAGQAVYVSSIPRETVAEIPNSTITSVEEGQRKVQVIRKNVVRDIIVNVLAPVGADRSYVSGPFQAEDELILATSLPLADGTQLSPKVTNPDAAGATSPGGTRSSGF